MNKLLTGSIFFIVLFSFVAHPAPTSIEVLDLVIIFLTLFVGACCIITTDYYILYKTEYNLLFAIALYFSYLLISFLIGILHDVSILKVLRSIGPYINFFPLLLLGLLPTKYSRPAAIGIIFISVGILQIIYLLYLYFTYSTSSGVSQVLVNRITFLDQRTTLPLLFAVTILPIVYSINYKGGSTKKKSIITLLALLIISLGFLGGIITLTRAIFLSIMVGWIVFFFLYLYYQSKVNSSKIPAAFKKIFLYVLFFITILLVLSCFEKIRNLESGLLSRFFYSRNHTDYSNGRLYDEWIPALTTWANSNVLGLMFGIGAGSPFVVLSGEERTYIHNLCIYNLVYGGFYGLFTSLFLYITLFITLVTRALQTRNIIYLAFSSLLISMFFYAQLFAVHKVLAFNVMLFLIIAIALSRPIQERDTIN